MCMCKIGFKNAFIVVLHNKNINPKFHFDARFLET